MTIPGWILPPQNKGGRCPLDPKIVAQVRVLRVRAHTGAPYPHCGPTHCCLSPQWFKLYSKENPERHVTHGMGRLPEVVVALVEEHILVQSPCPSMAQGRTAMLSHDEEEGQAHCCVRRLQYHSGCTECQH